MPKTEDRYTVTIGFSATKLETPPFADFGLVYGNLDAGDLTGLEALYNMHADEIMIAMRPLRDALIAIGIKVAEDAGIDMNKVKENMGRGREKIRP